MSHVVFICTANICRSPMAEGLLRHKAAAAGRTDIRTSSMGIHGMDNEPAAKLAVEVCMAHGVDIRHHRSRPISGEELHDADLVLCMEPEHRKFLQTFFPWNRDRVFLMGAWPKKENRKSPVRDPYGGPIEVYRHAYETMARHVDRILKHI